MKVNEIIDFLKEKNDKRDKKSIEKFTKFIYENFSEFTFKDKKIHDLFQVILVQSDKIVFDIDQDQKYIYFLIQGKVKEKIPQSIFITKESQNKLITDTEKLYEQYSLICKLSKDKPTKHKTQLKTIDECVFLIIEDEQLRKRIKEKKTKMQNEMIEALSKNVFTDSSKFQLQNLLEFFQLEKRKIFDKIITEGQKVKKAYFLLKGQIKLTKKIWFKLKKKGFQNEYNLLNKIGNQKHVIRKTLFTMNSGVFLGLNEIINSEVDYQYNTVVCSTQAYFLTITLQNLKYIYSQEKFKPYLIQMQKKFNFLYKLNYQLVCKQLNRNNMIVTNQHRFIQDENNKIIQQKVNIKKHNIKQIHLFQSKNNMYRSYNQQRDADKQNMYKSQSHLRIKNDIKKQQDLKMLNDIQKEFDCIENMKNKRRSVKMKLFQQSLYKTNPIQIMKQNKSQNKKIFQTLIKQSKQLHNSQSTTKIYIKSYLL